MLNTIAHTVILTSLMLNTISQHYLRTVILTSLMLNTIYIQ